MLGMKEKRVDVQSRSPDVRHLAHISQVDCLPVAMFIASNLQQKNTCKNMS